MNKYIHKIKIIFYRLKCNGEEIQRLNTEYYKELGMKIGSNLRCYSNIITPEPYLIELGNNITISAGVTFLTHDNSICKIFKDKTDVFGRVLIKDNCFIGMNTTILPGVTIGENTIVGAGSVVTKSFPNGNIVIAGNPAKKICTIEEYKEKINKYSLNTNEMNFKTKKEYILKNQNKLICK